MVAPALVKAPAQAAAVTPASYSVGHLAISLVRRPGTFSSPTLVTNAGDGSNRLFVVEQRGRIMIIDGSTRDRDAVPRHPLADQLLRGARPARPGIRPGVRDQPPLLRRLHGQERRHDHRRRTRPARPTRTGPARRQTLLLKIDQPYANHNGGMLAFGKDGYLYIGMGDGGSGGDPRQPRPEQVDSLLGKLLRIDVNHVGPGPQVRDPADQPVRRQGRQRPRSGRTGCATPGGSASTARPATCGSATSARTATRRSTGRPGAAAAAGSQLRLAQHRGQRLLPAVVRLHEDRQEPSDRRRTATSKGCAVIGGYVYRGTAYPAMTGAYLYRRLLLRPHLGPEGQRRLDPDRRPAAQLGPDDQLVRRGRERHDVPDRSRRRRGLPDRRVRQVTDPRHGDQAGVASVRHDPGAARTRAHVSTSSSGTHSFAEWATRTSPGPKITVGVAPSLTSSRMSAPYGSPMRPGRRPVTASTAPARPTGRA